MKTIYKLFAVLVSVMLFDLQMLSHGDCNNRSDCSWTLGEAYMYKALARVSRLAVPNQQVDKDCPYSAGGNGDGFAQAYVDNGCANQGSTNNNGAWSFWGSVYKTPGICSRGFEYSPLTYALSKAERYSELQETSQIQTGKIIFSKNAVTIPNINATIKVVRRNIYSYFEIVVFLPGRESEEIWRGKIELINGKVELTGAFPAEYTLTKSKTEKDTYILVITDLTIQVDLPEKIDITKDVVEVRGTTDAGVKEELIIEANLTEEKVAFTAEVFPNPSSTEFNIQLKEKDGAEISVVLYDSRGNMLKTLFEEQKYNYGDILSFNLYSMGYEKGVYYLLFQDSSGKTVLKRVMYE